MTKDEFDDYVNDIVKLIERLKARIDNDEINADTDSSYSASDGWANIRQAVDEADPPDE
jgi:hypothetical protein